MEYCEDFLQANYFFSKFDLKDSQENDINDIQCYVKDFYQSRHVGFLLKKIQNLDFYEHKIDGMIFTKVNFPYLPGKSCGVLKWKPDYLNTIDFLVVENSFYMEKYPEIFGNDDLFIFELFTIHKKKFAFFDVFFVFDPIAYMDLKSKFKEINIYNKKIDGAIIEFKYDKSLQKESIKKFYEKFFAYDSECIEALLESCYLKENLTDDIN